jgi:hypothetical protein
MNNQQTSTTTAENENIIENESLSTNNNVRNQPVVNIIEVSNVYPTNIVKHNLHARQRQLISKVRAVAYDTCRGKLPHEYIHSAFNKFKRGYIYVVDNKVNAFCIWKITDHAIDMETGNTIYEMYIYLICGIKLDYRLLPRILDDSVHYCRHNNISSISLKPASDELKHYYIANGFTTNEEAKNNTILKLDVSKSRISYPETRTAPTQTRRRTRRN